MTGSAGPTINLVAPPTYEQAVWGRRGDDGPGLPRGPSMATIYASARDVRGDVLGDVRTVRGGVGSAGNLLSGDQQQVVLGGGGGMEEEVQQPNASDEDLVSSSSSEE